jgi:hypothetical protein
VETKRSIRRTATNNCGFVVDEYTKNKTGCFDFVDKFYNQTAGVEQAKTLS